MTQPEIELTLTAAEGIKLQRLLHREDALFSIREKLDPEVNAINPHSSNFDPMNPIWASLSMDERVEMVEVSKEAIADSGEASWTGVFGDEDGRPFVYSSNGMVAEGWESEWVMIGNYSWGSTLIGQMIESPDSDMSAGVHQQDPDVEQSRYAVIPVDLEKTGNDGQRYYFAGPPSPRRQLIIADDNGVLPWEKGYDEGQNAPYEREDVLCTSQGLKLFPGLLEWLGGIS